MSKEGRKPTAKNWNTETYTNLSNRLRIAKDFVFHYMKRRFRMAHDKLFSDTGYV
jgi:hypothetical protein